MLLRGLFIFLLFLLGCTENGTSQLPPEIPTTSIHGVAFDGPITNGIIRIYDFDENGIKGILLGETTTDNEGLYDLDLQSESAHLLIELTEGSYREESNGATVSLNNGEILTALVNHSPGVSLSIAVTAYTHVATALSRHLVTTGSSVDDAINTANNRITQWVGVPVVETIPLNISNPANLSASVTPAHFYGFLSAGISSWVQDHVPAAVHENVIQNGCNEYDLCAIDFIQTMYADILADGLLNGVGAGDVDLSFGTAALNENVYRAELALALIEISEPIDNADYGNKTGLTGAQLLVRSRAYAASTDSIFSGVPPESVDIPAISVDSHANGSWVRSTTNIAGTVVDQIGPGYVKLFIDGVETGNSAVDYYTPSIPWNSTTVADGIHTFALTVINAGGLMASATVSVTVDNTKPSVVFSSVAEGSKCRITGTAADMPGVSIGSVKVSPVEYTGMQSIMNTTMSGSVMADVQLTETTSLDYDVVVVNNTASFLINKGPQLITVRDSAGNSTVVNTGAIQPYYYERSNPACITACYSNHYSKSPICSAPVIVN